MSSLYTSRPPLTPNDGMTAANSQERWSLEICDGLRGVYFQGSTGWIGQSETHIIRSKHEHCSDADMKQGIPRFFEIVAPSIFARFSWSTATDTRFRGYNAKATKGIDVPAVQLASEARKRVPVCSEPVSTLREISSATSQGMLTISRILRTLVGKPPT